MKLNCSSSMQIILGGAEASLGVEHLQRRHCFGGRRGVGRVPTLSLLS